MGPDFANGLQWSYRDSELVANTMKWCRIYSISRSEEIVYPLRSRLHRLEDLSGDNVTETELVYDYGQYFWQANMAWILYMETMARAVMQSLHRVPCPSWALLSTMLMVVGLIRACNWVLIAVQFSFVSFYKPSMFWFEAAQEHAPQPAPTHVEDPEN